MLVKLGQNITKPVLVPPPQIQKTNKKKKHIQQQTLWDGPCYLVTSHEAQVAEGLAALSDLCGSLVCDVLTPAGIHSLYSTAVLAYGYQSCGHRSKIDRGSEERGEEGRRERNKKRC